MSDIVSVIRCPLVDGMQLAVPSDDDIVAACGPNSITGTRVLDRQVADSPRLLVEFGHGFVVHALTQDYIYRAALNDPAAPRIPQVYSAFRKEHVEYMVTDYVELPSAEQWIRDHPSDASTVFDLIVSAEKWILGLPVPESGQLGPVGNGIAHHNFFKDAEAPRAFSDIFQLQEYVNTALQHFSLGWQNKPPIEFTSEPIVFYDAGVDLKNFLYDADKGQLWRVNFAHVGVFPRTFAEYALVCGKTEASRKVAKALGISLSANGTRMLSIAGNLQMYFDPTFTAHPKRAERSKTRN